MPERGSTTGKALLDTFTLPVTLPAEEGLNVVLKVAVCPGVRVSPVEIPLELKPAPDTLTFEIVIFEFPALVNVTF